MNREDKLNYEKEIKARRERMEMMRESVQEVELQARYWKALYDTKYYTLEDDKLKQEYEVHYVKVQQAADEAAEKLKGMQEQLQANFTAGSEITTANESIDEKA